MTHFVPGTIIRFNGYGYWNETFGNKVAVIICNVKNHGKTYFKVYAPFNTNDVARHFPVYSYADSRLMSFLEIISLPGNENEISH